MSHNWLPKFFGDKTYFISDLHFNHRNICRGTSSWENKEGCRDFETLEEMNETILKCISDTVPEDGVLINGGDILFGDKKQIHYFLSRIKVKEHHFIFGNHDDWIQKSANVVHSDYETENICDLFTTTNHYMEILCSLKGGGWKQVNLFHYPLKSWNNVNKGAYAITGHEHGDWPYEEWELGLDVGWEVFKRPISFYEVQEIMAKKQSKKIHHKGRE